MPNLLTMPNKALILFIIAVLVIAAGGGVWLAVKRQKSSPIQYVEISELLSSPQKYNGKFIETTGIWVSGFEVSGLSKEIIRTEEGVPQLSQPVIWLEAPAVSDRQNCFSAKEFMPPAEFCEVTVKGIFQTGGGYGHLGQYQYSIKSAGNRSNSNGATPVQPAVPATKILTGVVGFKKIEGGCPFLQTEDGKLYELEGVFDITGKGLQEFVGQKVKIAGEVATEMGSTCQLGQIFQVNSFKVLAP